MPLIIAFWFALHASATSRPPWLLKIWPFGINSWSSTARLSDLNFALWSSVLGQAFPLVAQVALSP